MPTVSEFWDGRAQNYDAQVGNHYAEAYEKTEKLGQTAPSFQFMRLGYFCLDSVDSTPDHLVFNRSVSLKDSFKK